MVGGIPIDVVERWHSPLLFALLTHADDPVERLFRVRVAELLLGAIELRGDGLDRDELLLLVDDAAGFLPRSRVWSILESVAILEADGEVYRLRDSVTLADLLAARQQRVPRALQDVRWTLEEMTAVFFPVEEVSWTVRGVRKAIHGGYRWFLWTLGKTEGGDRRFDVLPAFWEHTHENDTPVGRLRAITSVGDTLASLADSERFVLTLTGVPGDHRDALRFGLKEILKYTVERGEARDWGESQRLWNSGGFLPYDDQPESAYPTVDATWDAVYALASIYGHFDALLGGDAGVESLKQESAQTLIGAVEFLLRMQEQGEKAGWGIYRYMGGTPEVPAYEFTTAQTIVALSRATVTSTFEDAGRESLRIQTLNALSRAWTYLVSSSVRFEGMRVWAPYFNQSIGNYVPEDLLRATAWTGAGLLALYRAFDELRASIKPYLQDFVALAENLWKPNYVRIADVEFRVPMADRMHDVFGKWSNRLDTTVVILLLDLFNESKAERGLRIVFSDDLWERIERTVGEILKEQDPVHGHWGEPVDGLPLAAATAMAIQALQYYLVAAAHLASERDVSPTEV